MYFFLNTLNVTRQGNHKLWLLLVSGLLSKRSGHTYPSSVMPSINSFLLNSHCVAARNFHAMTNTLVLAGSKCKSSQNNWIPSMPILFSSCGSAFRREKEKHVIFQKNLSHVSSPKTALLNLRCKVQLQLAQPVTRLIEYLGYGKLILQNQFLTTDDPCIMHEQTS